MSFWKKLGSFFTRNPEQTPITIPPEFFNGERKVVLSLKEADERFRKEATFITYKDADNKVCFFSDVSCSGSVEDTLNTFLGRYFIPSTHYMPCVVKSDGYHSTHRIKDARGILTDKGLGDNLRDCKVLGSKEQLLLHIKSIH